ncbi:Aldose 1-epimerase family protein YeaD [Cronobacter universalis NCTC 9529]|nr:Aldose 1-epimerase family protein YeaD [Cronobacter universalis NCTC 9529]
MINTLFALPVSEQLTPYLSRRQHDELDIIVIDHPQVRAAVALQGAHLLCWKPAGEEEVLWLSANTPFIFWRRAPRRRADLLAVVWPFGAKRSAFARFRPQPAVEPERP